MMEEVEKDSMKSCSSHPHFNVTYILQVKGHDGKMELFDKTRGLQTADIGAETREEAVSNLKQMFNMLHVEVVSVSDRMEMSDQEYNGEASNGKA